jgi:prevent-host-death family protein
MKQLNIHEAKTNLSALVEEAYAGDSFIIAKAGRPMVVVGPYLKPDTKRSKVGFMKGEINIPADFDTMGQDEIEALFIGDLH